MVNSVKLIIIPEEFGIKSLVPFPVMAPFTLSVSLEGEDINLQGVYSIQQNDTTEL